MLNCTGLFGPELYFDMIIFGVNFWKGAGAAGVEGAKTLPIIRHVLDAGVHCIETANVSA